MRSLKDILNTNLTGSEKGKKKLPRKDRVKPIRSAKRRDFDLARVLLILMGPLGIIYMMTTYQKLVRARQTALIRAIRMIVANNAPLPDGLRTIADDAPPFYVRSILRQLSDMMQEGSTLWEALTLFPKYFPPRYTDLIKIAEENGRLVPALDDILCDIELSQENAAIVQSNMGYILLNIFALFGILSFMLLKVIPVFAEIFAEFGAPLPWVTQVLCDVSDSITYTIHTMGAIEWVFTLALPLLFLYALKFPRFRSILTSLMLPIPFLGSIVRYKQRLMIIEGLEIHLKSHHPLPQAFDQVARLTLARPYQRAMKKIHDQLMAGHSVKEAFSHNTFLMGHRFGTILTLSESAGTLGEACGRLKEMYRSEISFRTTLLTEAMIPAYAVVGGSISGWIVVSLYLPIFGLSDIMFANM